MNRTRKYSPEVRERAVVVPGALGAFIAWIAVTACGAPGARSTDAPATVPRDGSSEAARLSLEEVRRLGRHHTEQFYAGTLDSLWSRMTGGLVEEVRTLQGLSERASP